MRILVALLFLATLVVIYAAIAGSGERPQLSRIASAPGALPSVSETAAPKPHVPSQYIEIVDSCGPDYGGPCVNARSGPGTDYPTSSKLRTGIVLKVDESVERQGRTWYHVVFDEWLRYPERVTSPLYVAADYVRAFQDGSEGTFPDGAHSTSSKYIIVDRTLQRLFAWDGDTLFMEQPISTGLELTPTPRGIFRVYRKTPSRYMQGPLPGISDQFYDLPGVPWNLYFTAEGGAIHGAYWHTNFGSPWSHGCVNLPPEKAHELYDWAELGTKVIVQD